MVRKFKTASVIGGGVIGSSFTLLFAMGGMNVKNYNRSAEGELKSKNNIETYLNELVEKNVVLEEDRNIILSRISFTNSQEDAIKYADIIEEALPENYAIKKEFVKTFESFSDRECVLCSAT